jgi:hypothetical protein
MSNIDFYITDTDQAQINSVITLVDYSYTVIFTYKTYPVAVSVLLV